MRCRIDPKLEVLVRVPKPGTLPGGCATKAKRLLHCLGLPVDEVRRAKVRKVTIDIHLDDCC